MICKDGNNFYHFHGVMTLSDWSGWSGPTGPGNQTPAFRVVLYCTVLWNRNDLLSFRFRLWKSLGSGSSSGSGSGSGSDHVSGSRQYFLHSFSTTKKGYKILHFQLQKQQYFPESSISFLIFELFYPFYVGYMLGTDPNRLRNRIRNRNLNWIRNRNAFRIRFRLGKKLRFLQNQYWFHNTGVLYLTHRYRVPCFLFRV
jgi:hypothetical protein